MRGNHVEPNRHAYLSGNDKATPSLKMVVKCSTPGEENVTSRRGCDAATLGYGKLLPPILDFGFLPQDTGGDSPKVLALSRKLR